MSSAAGPPGASGSALNVPNALTGLRLLLVPVFATLLLSDAGSGSGTRVAAAGVFLLAMWTDRLDGRLARRWGLVTPFGTLADPIADKALTGAAFVGLSALGELPWAVTVVVLAREVGVTVLRLLVIQHGVLPASRGGKLKTGLQGLALLLYVLPLVGMPASARAWVMAVAVVVTLLTGVDYVVRAVHLRRTSERTRSQQARGAGPGGARP